MNHILYGMTSGNGTRTGYPFFIFVLLILLLVAGCGGGDVTVTGSISGEVRDGDEKVPGVTVTVQGTDISVVTDAAGAFLLKEVPTGTGTRISAWKEGYYCGLLAEVTVPAYGVVVNIRRHQLLDYANYEWISPDEGPDACMQCHPGLTGMAKQDAHLGSAKNRRFLSAYYGRDVLGNQSPDTTYRTVTTQWGTFDVPQPYDRSQPYYGPGWRIDFPNDTGNCTSCHIPGAAVDRDVDPSTVRGADQYGVHCDFCHKMGYVHLDGKTGLPSVNRPGVQNIDLFRPDVSSTLYSQLFMGSLADGNTADAGVRSPYGGTHVTTFEAKKTLYSESLYCAPCHYGGFWGQAVYTSYREWAESPYADTKSAAYKTCQNCHMPSPTLYDGKAITNIAPGKGGVERHPASLHSHQMTVTPELLRDSLTMDASASLNGNEIKIDVTLTNDRTGHHIPTDSPLRHMILLVEARDGSEKMLAMKKGSTLPAWCGVGESKDGCYAHLPGKVFAKVLKEMWTEVTPAISYWRHTTVESDNRLAALASDRSSYSFQFSGSPVQVTVTLIYRRAYIDMMKQKGWDSPDIVIARKNLTF